MGREERKVKTVEIGYLLHRQAKIQAAIEGISLRSLLEKLIADYLEKTQERQRIRT